MTRTNATDKNEGDVTRLRDEWLVRLQELTANVKAWAEQLDWSTRGISKNMNDSRLGRYVAPALIMQKDATRVLLDPVSRFAPGTDGIVDLYLMPGYDDIATLYLAGGGWRVHHVTSGEGRMTAGNLAQRALTKETLAQLLDEIAAHAPEPL
ncbi:MAG TPA: hypothetical protein VFI31_29090 [Pirellulales bacterium]|nr:hypothetical protein [Pirellulales bacterium]